MGAEEPNVANAHLTFFANFRRIRCYMYPVQSLFAKLRQRPWSLKMEALMKLRTRLAFSRLVSLLTCICGFAVLSLPQLTVLTLTESAHTEGPHEGERENSVKELVVCSSARGRLKHRRHGGLSLSDETRDRLHQIASYAAHRPTIVGHRFANGLRAPLLI